MRIVSMKNEWQSESISFANKNKERNHLTPTQKKWEVFLKQEFHN